MTNRPDLIDDALMRPGRFEVKMEIGECYKTIITIYKTNYQLALKELTFLPLSFLLHSFLSILPISLFRPPGLPDEKGRVQILNIHTNKMRSFNLLASDVNVNELAVETKNYSGAELEGLVRAAQSTAMNRHIKVRESLRTTAHNTTM